MNIDIISATIRDTRKSVGMTQKELAKKSGVSIATIQGYEQKKFAPKLDTLKKIASGLGLSVLALVPASDLDYLDQLEMSAELTTSEKDLLNCFNTLNSAGQDKAIEQIEMISEIPRYKKEF